MPTRPETRRITLDGAATVEIQCPGCGQWGPIDDDQYHGRISIDCPDCPYHETHDLSRENSDVQ